MIAPIGYIPFQLADQWQVGVIFSEVDQSIHMDADWLDHRIRVSVRPNEWWVDAYVRQFHEPPEKRFICFLVEGM